MEQEHEQSEPSEQERKVEAAAREAELARIAREDYYRSTHADADDFGDCTS